MMYPQDADFIQDAYMPKVNAEIPFLNQKILMIIISYHAYLQVDEIYLI